MANETIMMPAALDCQ